MSHYDSLYSSSPDVARVHTIYGDPVQETVRPNNESEDVQLAESTIFRPYEKPKRKVDGRVRCATDGCRAFPTKTGHCVGHSRSLGLIENWNQEGRKPNESV